MYGVCITFLKKYFIQTKTSGGGWCCYYCCCLYFASIRNCALLLFIISTRINGKDFIGGWRVYKETNIIQNKHMGYSLPCVNTYWYGMVWWMQWDHLIPTIIFLNYIQFKKRVEFSLEVIEFAWIILVVQKKMNV